MDAVTALRRLGGAAKFADLRPLVARRALAEAVGRGRVVKPLAGTYALPEVPPYAVAAARFGGVVSHATAAGLWGCELLAEPTALDVTVPASTGRRAVPAGISLHRLDLGPDDRVGPLTSVDRTILDCARTLPLPQSVVIGDSALRGGLLAVSGLRDAADLATLRRRAAALRGTGSRRVRAAVTLLDPHAESVLESLFRTLVHLAGFAAPRTQMSLLDGAARVDFFWPGARLVVEVEGYAFHSGRDALRRDCRRFNALVLARFRPLRFTWDDVMFRPEYVIETLRAGLAEAGAPPRSEGESSDD